MSTINLNDFTVKELKDLRDRITADLKNRRDAILKNARDLKVERAGKFNRTTINENDTINFMFNREEKTANVDRVNEKSVTVELDDKKKYIKYENIVAIVVETTEEEAATEVEEAATEEVA